MQNDRFLYLSTVARMRNVAWILAVLTSLGAIASAATGTGKVYTVALPNKTFELELVGVAPTASWAVGAIASDGQDAKLAILRTTIQKSQARNSMEGLSELSSDHTTFRPGSCKVTLRPSETDSVGVIVRAPVGTEFRITVNGKLYASSILSSSFMLQDGTPRPEPLKSVGEFVLKMHMQTPTAQSDFIKRNNVLYVAPTMAHNHLSRFTRPSALSVGCCGNRVTVTAQLSIDAGGNVTTVKCRTSSTVDVGPIETLLLSWKFDPFVYEGRPTAVRLIAPILFVDNTVMSPLF